MEASIRREAMVALTVSFGVQVHPVNYPALGCLQDVVSISGDLGFTIAILLDIMRDAVPYELIHLLGAVHFLPWF